MMSTRPLWAVFEMDGVEHEAPCDKKGFMADGHEPSMNCWCAPDLEAYCPACHGKTHYCPWCMGSAMVEGSILEAENVVRVVHRDMTSEHE